LDKLRIRRDFAVTANHIHVVARTRPDLAADWSDEELARRRMPEIAGRSRDPGVQRTFSRASDIHGGHSAARRPSTVAVTPEATAAGIG